MKSEALKLARFAYECDTRIKVGDNWYEDVWEEGDEYVVRATIHIPKRVIEEEQ